MKKHVLPGEVGDDTAWFERLTPFEQQETARQVHFKRSHWPELEDGAWSRRSTYKYPHILPKCHLGKAFYAPVAEDIRHYVERNDIALHTEILNLRSSQAACLNMLFPFRLNLNKAAVALADVLQDAKSIANIEFEYTGPAESTKWLGEPPGGRRGQNRTSIDAAIWWEDTASQKRLTFIEFKYTERELGSCGGYRSKGNKHPERCEELDIHATQPQVNCFLENGEGARTSRHYWKHLAEAGISLKRFGDVKGCPFRGPFYQLMRQYLLAAYCRSHVKDVNEVDVVVLGFRGNESLLEVSSQLKHLGSDIVGAWNSVLEGVPPLRMVHVEDLASHIAIADADWAKYLNERYGL